MEGALSKLWCLLDAGTQDVVAKPKAGRRVQLLSLALLVPIISAFWIVEVLPWFPLMVLAASFVSLPVIYTLAERDKNKAKASLLERNDYFCHGCGYQWKYQGRAPDRRDFL